jgi:c-di-GMP-binding flagellar brake protein YcgR
MAAWLSKMLQNFSGDSEVISVREVLAAVHRSRQPVELRATGPGGVVTIMSATIEQVRKDDLVITQPSVGGFTRQLTTDERLTLRVFERQRGHLEGSVSCLGRIKVPSGSQTMLYGYSLSLPEQLEPSQRRDEIRHIAARPAMPEAELFTFTGHATAVRGSVMELSASGMKLTSRNAKGRVGIGQRAYLKVQLPQPVGLITELVRITTVNEGGEADELIVGVVFDEKIEQLAELNLSGGAAGGPASAPRRKRA